MSNPPDRRPTGERHESHSSENRIPEFAHVVERRLTRRRLLGGIAFGAAAFVAGSGLTAVRRAGAATHPDFEPVAANTLDTVTVPEGYNWHVVVRWGDPLWSRGAEFDHRSHGTAETQALAMGDNNDGMALFRHDGRKILAVNNEYTNTNIMFAARESGLPETDDDVAKGKAAHGVTICELADHNGLWSVVRDSGFNRRITPDTRMRIGGPARGHALLRTAADPDGALARGTWNNCGSGRTPWGTYLACEENFNGYFASSNPDIALTRAQKRYGIGRTDRGYGWMRIDERFDISKHPNEPNRAGYVVEIDPLDPDSVPVKRTALGRFKHENAELVLAADGRVAVYLGDDERGEYLYRFVSSGRYSPDGDNRDLLESGTLHVAKFHEDGSGQWIALTPKATGFSSQAEICVLTRLAASRVGATTMDRPEWVAANPSRPEVFCALTNNKHRGVRSNRGGDEMPVGGPNPRRKNLYGQIVRWRPENGDHGAERFSWDLFVTAGNPAVHADEYSGSANVHSGNMFNSPDGLAFDSAGRLWIQTDGNYSDRGDFAGMGNNQMLIGDPATGEIRRFMVGPRECEITGLCWSPDRRTAFIGIQHPGERGGSRFPDGGGRTPRSCIIAISRDDRAVIG